MIKLTPAQRQAVAQKLEVPPRAIDPDTQTTYVLIPEEMYDRVKALFEDGDADKFVRDVRPLTMKVFGREGWDDPSMDIYDDLDPRKQL